jgi:hypothetical protein
MTLQKVLVGTALLVAAQVALADSWAPRNKDDFDIPEQTINEDHYEVEPIEQKKPEVVDPDPLFEPAPEAEPKPEVKTYKNLKSTPAQVGGKPAKFDQIVIFSCANIEKRVFLFNKKMSGHCIIKDVKDAAAIAKKIGVDEFKKRKAVFETCPEAMASEKTCNPKLLRNF